jgi:hypothetical protein
MAEKYFVLSTSTGSLTKRFQILQSGYKNILEKTQTVDKTLDGNLDISMGGLYLRFEYLVRVREQEDRPDYGDIADLKTFFSLNNPNGTPSNVITMTTNFGEEYNVVMLGSYSEQYLGVMITGPYSWALVQCYFQSLSATPNVVS